LNEGLLFIFDMDDVLYKFDWSFRMRGMSELTGLSIPDLHSRWWNGGGEAAAEAGEYSTAGEYLAAFQSAIGSTVGVQDWLRVRGDAMTPLPESIAAVRRASELGQITLLTNNGPLVQDHLAALAPELADLFGEHLLTSSSYGARKPDRAVFDRVLASYGVEARNAFFADDLPDNIRGATAVGITAHLFTTPVALLDAIEAFAASRR
jgi:HAD superfamily hydrolase (TIGR01509 family)